MGCWQGCRRWAGQLCHCWPWRQREHNLSMPVSQTTDGCSLTRSLGNWVFYVFYSCKLPTSFSVATCLGAKRVSQRSYEWLSQHPILTHTVTDRQALSACINIAGIYTCIMKGTKVLTLGAVDMSSHGFTGHIGF